MIDEFTMGVGHDCALTGWPLPKTGLWGGTVTHKIGDSAYVSAPSRQTLLDEAVRAAAGLARDDASRLAAGRANRAAERQRLAALKKYPPLMCDVGGLKPGWLGQAIRQAGQPNWSVSLDDPDDGVWLGDKTYPTRGEAAAAARAETRRRLSARAKAVKEAAKHDKAVAAATAAVLAADDLAAAGELAWDVAIGFAARLGVPIDTRNGPADTCCDAQRRGVKDSSRVVAIRDGRALVRSVYWTHHSKKVHGKRERVILVGVVGHEPWVEQVPPGCRTVSQALAVVKTKKAKRHVTETDDRDGSPVPSRLRG